jgi:hypothetical protein
MSVASSVVKVSSSVEKNNKDIVHPENKICTLIWKRNEYGLTILTMENAKGSDKYEKPLFYIPLRTFMRCGAIWSALNLCTIFWEQRPYRIERTFQETERIKGAYLLEFIPDVAPISKGWAKECIDKLHDWPRKLNTDEVFVEIIVFQESLKNKIMDAIQIHMLDVFVSNDIFNVFEMK